MADSRPGRCEFLRTKKYHWKLLVVSVLVFLGTRPASATPGFPNPSSSGDEEKFCQVRGGTFQMGDVWGDGDFAIPERPVHEVEVGNFLLGRYEVTVSEFESFVRATGYRTRAETQPQAIRLTAGEVKAGKNPYPRWNAHFFEQDGRHPVVWLAWEDATAYCNWLSRQNGLPPAYDEKTGQFLDRDGAPTEDVRKVVGFRLPTEAEWEFAARERGKKVRFGNGQDIARASEMNFDAAGTGAAVPSLRLPAENRHPYNKAGETRGRPIHVGSFPPNALGLYDMSGNAWEWCSDSGCTGYSPAKQVNPRTRKEGGAYILRGGTFDTDAKACRVSARIDWGPGSRCPASGFRVARTVEP
ncbi:MAG: hypothetical protein EHM61_26255 [Acidobacteria bacterium]|nr:MAG: hypothetical protein EHM61_26255 [Acidobacteriota bacterium]